MSEKISGKGRIGKRFSTFKLSPGNFSHICRKLFNLGFIRLKNFTKMLNHAVIRLTSGLQRVRVRSREVFDSILDSLCNAFTGPVSTSSGSGLGCIES